MVGLTKCPTPPPTPYDVHILMSETVQCYLMWQECFTDTLQLMISSWRGDSGGHGVLSMPLRTGRQGPQSQKRRLGSVGSRGRKTSADGGRSPQPTNVGSPSPLRLSRSSQSHGHLGLSGLWLNSDCCHWKRTHLGCFELPSLRSFIQQP